MPHYPAVLNVFYWVSLRIIKQESYCHVTDFCSMDYRFDTVSLERVLVPTKKQIANKKNHTWALLLQLLIKTRPQGAIVKYYVSGSLGNTASLSPCNYESVGSREALIFLLQVAAFTQQQLVADFGRKKKSTEKRRTLGLQWKYQKAQAIPVSQQMLSWILWVFSKSSPSLLCLCGNWDNFMQLVKWAMFHETLCFNKQGP